METPIQVSNISMEKVSFDMSSDIYQVDDDNVGEMDIDAFLNACKEQVLRQQALESIRNNNMELMLRKQALREMHMRSIVNANIPNEAYELQDYIHDNLHM